MSEVKDLSLAQLGKAVKDVIDEFPHKDNELDLKAVSEAATHMIASASVLIETLAKFRGGHAEVKINVNDQLSYVGEVYKKDKADFGLARQEGFDLVETALADGQMNWNYEVDLLKHALSCCLDQMHPWQVEEFENEFKKEYPVEGETQCNSN